MPFWKRLSPEEEQRRNLTLQEAEASRQSLEMGGLPLQAKRRLSEEVEAGHPLFSSDLSTNEFLLARNKGYTPLSQVMGSSIYHMGWQYVRSYSWNTSASELTTVSNAHQHAAQLALGRLEQEAALLKAHGVIGVRLTTRDYEWGQNLPCIPANSGPTRSPWWSSAPQLPRAPLVMPLLAPVCPKQVARHVGVR